MKKILLILGLVTLFSIFVQTASAASLNLSTTTAAPKVGEEFWVEIYLDNQNQATLGTDIVLIFDPQLLEVVEIKEGNLYSSYPGQKINNEEGKIYFSGVADYGNSLSASGVLGEIKFSPKKEGKTQIFFEWEPGNTNLTSVVPYTGQENLLTQPPQSLSLSIEKQTLIGKIIAFIRRLIGSLPF